MNKNELIPTRFLYESDYKKNHDSFCNQKVKKKAMTLFIIERLHRVFEEVHRLACKLQ